MGLVDLTGKIAMVSGAAAGIGRATALSFAQAGATVALVDVNQSGVKEVAQQIERGGGRASEHRADLSRIDEIRGVFAEVLEVHGRLDALANVAAIYPACGVLEITEEHWDRVLGLDLRGVFFCCQEALRIMLEQGSGAIVNVASGAAFRPLEGMAAYCAAKAGVLGMTRVLALESARRGVRVNVIAPGHTATDGTLAGSSREELDEQAQTLVSGRYLEPEEIASGIVFLCSSAASGIHGAILNINGGNLMP